MARQIYGNYLIVAVASALGACAANAPVSPGTTATASTSTPATAAAVAAPKTAKDPTAGYRKVVKNGQEVYCRKESVTGSRTEVMETCLTLAQIETARENSQDLMRRLGSVPGASMGVDSNGGQTNTAMGH